ncbi:HAD family hydrolase [Anoxynatronum sibiricum]|uniref:HAD family hydrolase n=1 Tax=Anoxynatronum sibiricum TaxID=210623 RepID=A0ABU9VXC0_9CLOT
MHYRLVASDVDGTLIDEDGTVNRNTLELMKRFREQGGYLTIATGRMKEAVVPLARTIGVNAPLILYNGGVITELEGSRHLVESFLDSKEAMASIMLAEAMGVGILLYHQGNAYTQQKTTLICQHNEKEKVSCQVVDMIEPLVKKGLTKILYIADEHIIDKLHEAHCSIKADSWNLIRSETTYLELLPQGVSKGNALRMLGEMLQVSMKETVALGDERNDLSMIQVAGVGVAVQNANPKLKACADVVTREQRSSGVGEILQRILQGELLINNEE